MIDYMIIDICESSASSRAPLFTNLLSKHTPTLGYIPQRLRGIFQDRGYQHPAVRPGGGVQEVDEEGKERREGKARLLSAQLPSHSREQKAHPSNGQ